MCPQKADVKSDLLSTFCAQPAHCLLSTLQITQDDTAQLRELLGAGRNGKVQNLSTANLPGAVFKSGSAHQIQSEADAMLEIRHPNVVMAYGTAWGFAKSDGSLGPYLILERLKCSLQDKLHDPKW